MGIEGLTIASSSMIAYLLYGARSMNHLFEERIVKYPAKNGHDDVAPPHRILIHRSLPLLQLVMHIASTMVRGKLHESRAILDEDGTGSYVATNMIDKVMICLDYIYKIEIL